MNLKPNHILAIVLISCADIAALAYGLEKVAPPAAARTVFEYKTVEFAEFSAAAVAKYKADSGPKRLEAVSQALNDLARDGWRPKLQVETPRSTFSYIILEREISK